MNRPEETAVERLWTVDDVMQYLCVSRSWVYAAIAKGHIPALRLQGLLRFKADAVRAWAEGAEQSAPVLTLKGRS